MGKDGVSVPTKPENNGRDDSGRFAPGNPGGPGRPSQRQEVAMVNAIKATMPPERIQHTLEQALQMAFDANSWRGVMAVVEFAANYTVGKPVQRIQQESSGVVGILGELGINIEE